MDGPNRCILVTRSWHEILAPYARPDNKRAAIQLLNTGLPFLGLMAALLYGVDRGVWMTLPLALPAAALLVRLFMIQHDCGHRSFFTSRGANDLLGRMLGILTLTPYTFWRKSHAIHHATSGNLDRRGVGDVTTLTVCEYFLIRHRIPTGSPLRHRQNWLSILGTDAAIAAVIALVVLRVGPRAFLPSYAPVTLLAASAGVWLFFIQHHSNHTERPGVPPRQRHLNRMRPMAMPYGVAV